MTQTDIQKCTWCSAANALKYLEALNATMDKYLINTPLRQAHFLSQIGHESLSLVYTKELASGAAYENRADLGNVRPGDGVKYKGRGLIQITGRANYRSYGDFIGTDIEESPLLLETLPYCVDSAGWFWNMHDLNIFADKDDIETITKRINGGTNGLPDRKRRLASCKSVLNLT